MHRKATECSTSCSHLTRKYTTAFTPPLSRAQFTLFVKKKRRKKAIACLDETVQHDFRSIVYPRELKRVFKGESIQLFAALSACAVLMFFLFYFFYYVSLQWMEAGASGASGLRVAPTVQRGGAGSAPSPHLAPGAKTARGSTSSLSTVLASSAHRVSLLPPTYCKTCSHCSTQWNNSKVTESRHAFGAAVSVEYS